MGNECQYPRIISQTLTSERFGWIIGLTQILPESTTLEQHYNSIVQKDFVAGTTKVLNVTGRQMLQISLYQNRLIIKGWSVIGMLWGKPHF